jgi:hypothetical protein
MIQPCNQRTGRPDVLSWCSSVLRIVLFFLLLPAQTLFVAPGFAQSSAIKPILQSSAPRYHQSSRRHVHRSTMPTPTPTPIPASSPSPDFDLHITGLANSIVTAGTPVSFSLNVCNSGDAAEIFPNSVSVTGVIPAGLSDVSVTGMNWSVFQPNIHFSTSPELYSEHYTGSYPILAGQCLPTLTISGTLTLDAIPLFTLQGTVAAAGDFAESAKLDSVSLTVVSATATPTAEPTVFATVIPKATSTAGPTVTPTIVVMPTITPTGTVLATPTAVATPDLALSLTGATRIQVGQSLRYAVNICNKSVAGTISDPRSIVVNSVLPLGMSNITVAGADWQVTSLSSLIGPALLTINYTGALPLLKRGCLGPFYISGVATSDAQPVMTILAAVTTQNDLYAFNNSSMFTTYVSPTLVLIPTVTKTVCKSCANAFCRCSFRIGF